MNEFWKKWKRAPKEETEMEAWARRAVDECKPKTPVVPADAPAKDARGFHLWLTYLTADDGPVRVKCSGEVVGYAEAKRQALSFIREGAGFPNTSGEMRKFIAPGAVLTVEIEEVTA